MNSVRATNRAVHLLDRLAVLHHRRRLTTVVFLGVVAVMMFRSYTTIPMYRARARLLIDDERSTMIAGIDADDPAYWADPEPYYETQYRILQSRSLAEQTAAKLDADGVSEPGGQAPQRLSLRTVLGSAAGRVSSFVGSLVATSASAPPAVEAEPAPEDNGHGEALALAARIAVEPVINSRLVDVYFTAADPGFATRALNTHVEEYVRQNLSQRLENTTKTLTWLGEELARQRATVETSERALAQYQESQDAVSLEDRQNIVVARLSQLNEAVTTAKMARAQKEALYHQVQGLDATSEAAAAFPAIAQNPAVHEITVRLANLRAEKVRLSERYGDKHPIIVNLNASLADAADQLRTETARAIESLSQTYQSALAEERELSAQLEHQKHAAMDLNRKNVSYSVLEREAESNRKVYETLLQQEKELRVISNSRANNVRIMDRAQVPAAPFKPNRRRDWLTATLLGLMLSVGLAYSLEYLDDTIKTPDDLTRRLQLPFLGLVPAIGGDRTPLLMGDTPYDFGEAFRALRTSVVFSSDSEPPRILTVTSTQPLEGKTTTACNLAMTLAHGGARVLVIDADMRRPSVHTRLGLANAIGLSHLLTGQARIRDAMQRTDDPNLFALTAGKPPPNPSELLASNRMKSFLARLTTGPFEWVIVDTPPVLAATDAVVVAHAVSGVVFVVGAGATRESHAARALDMLRSGGRPHVIGAVLNRVNFARDKYYYSRYYGYHYKSYYGQTTEAA